MGEVVNLRLARKRRLRAGQEADAAANRALHGRTKQAKAADETQRRRRETLLDGHRLPSPAEGDEP
jgi:hypothetical protein